MTMSNLPEGWVSFTGPDGQTYFEPPVADPMSGTQTQPAAPSPFVPVAPVDPSARPNVQPVPGSEQVTGDSYRPAGTLPGLEAPPQDPRGMADRAGAGQLTPPQNPMGAADRAPMMVPQTTTETTTQTTGVDKATAASINAATGQANEAARQAGAAKVGEMQATSALDQRQAQEAYGRGVNQYFETAAQLATQDEVIRETNSRLEQAAQFKPDRTALFHGDQGALFGVSAAVAAMAGGWLMGQGLTGGRNPYLDAVFKIIDDNAKDQIAQNGQVYQELTRRLGSAEAAKKELKARQLQALNDTIDAKARFERSGLVQQGAARVQADVQAEIAKNQLEAAKLTGKTATTTVQKKMQMVPNLAASGGVDVTDPKEYERVGKVAALRDFASEAEGLAQSGALADNVGFLDGKWAWIKGAVNARDPKQARVEALKAKWELAMRADWKSEPNGQEVQARLSQIGFPQNDAEIPYFLQSVREALNTADPGGRYRIAARAMGSRPQAVETRRIPIVR